MTAVDIPKLRADAEADFQKQASAYFAEHPKVQSLVFAVAQYFADEAPDAVHSLAVAYPTSEPWWPHRCDWQEMSEDGSWCERCAATNRGKLPFGSLEPNDEAVYAWSAFCPEDVMGEGESQRHEPVLIARRGPDGQAAVERVGHLARPWLDFPRSFADRDPAWVPLPEPAAVPWTPEEQAMVDRICANPEDDSLRRVLIDHWLDRGDPRGEYGALSFDGKAGVPDRAWLGPLTASVGYAAAELGRGPFARRVVATMPAGDLPAHREWATVEALRFSTDSAQRFFPTMTALREVHGLTEAGLRALAASGLTRIHTLGVRLDHEGSGAIAGALKANFALKELKTLILEDVPAGFDVGPVVAVFAAQLARVEVWLTGEIGWSRPGAARIFEQLVAQRPGLQVSIGHQAASGAKRGLVATARAGERAVALSHRGFPNTTDLAAARAQLTAFSLLPLSAATTAVPEAPPLPDEGVVPPPPAALPRSPVQRPIAALVEAAKGTSTSGWGLIVGVLLAIAALLLAQYL